jgi:magnesium transporter
VTFLGVHLLNLSRLPEPPLEPNHSALEGGLMHPRLSLQGRLSIDGWHSIVEGRGSGLNSPRTPRTAGHGRRSSLYRAQTSVLFNAFEDGDEEPADNVGLHQLREEDESEDDDANERTRLQSSRPIKSLSRSNSHSTTPR